MEFTWLDRESAIRILYFICFPFYRMLTTVNRDTTLLSGVQPALALTKSPKAAGFLSCTWGTGFLLITWGAYSLSTSTDFNGFERAHIYPVVTAKTWLAIHQSCLKNTIN